MKKKRIVRYGIVLPGGTLHQRRTFVSEGAAWNQIVKRFGMKYRHKAQEQGYSVSPVRLVVA